ncbi:hypothetical protein [Paraburkholderia panacisoli]|uniref:hypothetical protein n=1 Tax=Paraburkholderia panacisoli TaxID=2603818 RepID=UPI00165F9CFA|nr:hypothetical protein [Paraburkholderia panacisoli]
MLAEPIRPLLVNSTTSQYKLYFAYGSRSSLYRYRDKALISLGDALANLAAGNGCQQREFMS